MITPTFVNVAGGDYAIDNLVVNGADDTMANIQVMNEKGEWVGQYYWYNDGGEGFPAGWFDFMGLESANVALKPGYAVFFNTTTPNVTVQSAGQVAGEVRIEIPSGYSMIGNPSPVAIDINDFAVEGADDTMVNIQVMNAKGDWVGQYYWYNDGGEGFPAGWFDFMGLEAAVLTLNPGDSVFVNTTVDGARIVVPSAL